MGPSLLARVPPVGTLMSIIMDFDVIIHDLAHHGWVHTTLCAVAISATL